MSDEQLEQVPQLSQQEARQAALMRPLTIRDANTMVRQAIREADDLTLHRGGRRIHSETEKRL